MYESHLQNELFDGCSFSRVYHGGMAEHEEDGFKGKVEEQGTPALPVQMRMLLVKPLSHNFDLRQLPV